MSHEITEENGKALMAYSVEVPWHKLGERYGHLMTLDEVEERQPEIFFPVETRPAYILDDNGVPVPIEGQYATTRIDTEGNLRPFTVVKGRYVVRVNKEVALDCLEIVEQSSGDAVIDTIGVLRDYSRFFITISLDPIIVDPRGVNDVLDRYLVAWTSHDGTLPEMFCNTAIRVLCANTATMAFDKKSSETKAIFAVRHTPNAGERRKQAQAALNMSTAWAEAFREQAERMLTVPVGSDRLEWIIDKVWPKKAADTDRKLDIWATRADKIRTLFANEKNAQAVGANGWAAYGAITEWLDHFSQKDVHAMAEASMDLTSIVSQRKETAAAAVLSLARV